MKLMRKYKIFQILYLILAAFNVQKSMINFKTLITFLESGRSVFLFNKNRNRASKKIKKKLLKL